MMTPTDKLIVPVLLSGGTGSRLWPLSREAYPKQLLSLLGEKTLLQQTAMRTSANGMFTNPVVVANAEHRFVIGEQLREASSVKLIHLGACLTMAGSAPQEIRKASKLSVPVSGYTRTADWAGSAVIDFAYLDLVLSRQMAPGEAVREA